MAAIEMLLNILAGDVIAVPDTANPVLMVEQLLLAHGNVYAEPLSTWMFRLHATLAWSGHPHLHEQGLHIFNGIDQFWVHLLDDLVTKGHLMAMDSALVTPMILGPIERATIISRLLFGERDVPRPDLSAVATHSARMLFSQWGSDAFWAGPYCEGLSARRLQTDTNAPLIPEDPTSWAPCFLAYPARHTRYASS
ncbi:MAG: hypothetical protein HC777_02370 [Hyphomonadaceae bacterium]|nr:hypothetical protein [Hyphomonadaceae bacterium]